jgi:hypothetical protein
LTRASNADTAQSPVRNALFSALIGFTSLVILLQGLWAGLFIREGKDFDESAAQSRWVEVHDWGARVAIVLALVSLIVAAIQLRARRDLLIGTLVLFLVLMLEAYIGGEIGGHPSWPSYHVPVAMLLMAMSVWLPFRATRR